MSTKETYRIEFNKAEKNQLLRYLNIYKGEEDDTARFGLIAGKIEDSTIKQMYLVFNRAILRYNCNIHIDTVTDDGLKPVEEWSKPITFWLNMGVLPSMRKISSIILETVFVRYDMGFRWETVANFSGTLYKNVYGTFSNIDTKFDDMANGTKVRFRVEFMSHSTYVIVGEDFIRRIETDLDKHRCLDYAKISADNGILTEGQVEMFNKLGVKDVYLTENKVLCIKTKTAEIVIWGKPKISACDNQKSKKRKKSKKITLSDIINKGCTEAGKFTFTADDYKIGYDWNRSVICVGAKPDSLYAEIQAQDTVNKAKSITIGNKAIKSMLTILKTINIMSQAYGASYYKYGFRNGEFYGINSCAGCKDKVTYDESIGNFEFQAPVNDLLALFAYANRTDKDITMIVDNPAYKSYVIFYCNNIAVMLDKSAQPLMSDRMYNRCFNTNCISSFIPDVVNVEEVNKLATERIKLNEKFDSGLKVFADDIKANPFYNGKFTISFDGVSKFNIAYNSYMMLSICGMYINK